MGRDHSEKKRMEETIKEKDAKIQDLKTVMRACLIRINELEAEVASLQKSRMPSDSKETELPRPIFKLPELPLLLRGKGQPTSVLANLPARPVFTGFDTPDERPALKTPLSIPEASPEGLPPRPTGLFSSTKSTLDSTTPPKLPTSLEIRPKGAVAPLLPPHTSSRAIPSSPPPATASTLSRDPSTRSTSSHDSSKPTSLSLSAIKGVFHHHVSLILEHSSTSCIMGSASIVPIILLPSQSIGCYIDALNMLELRILTCLQAKRRRTRGLIQSNVEYSLSKAWEHVLLQWRLITSKDGGSGKSFWRYHSPSSSRHVSINSVY